MRIKECIKSYKENLAMSFVWLLPKWVVYYCAIRLFTHATTTHPYTETVASDVTIFDAIERWYL